MDVVVINGSLTSFIRKSWRASLIFKTWDASHVFAASLLLKLALKFSQGSAFSWHTLQAGHRSGFFFKVDERESGELFEELFWNDVAYFFMMNINILLLGPFERRRNGNDIFSLQNCLAEMESSFVLNVAFSGRRKQCWRRISRVSLEAEAVRQLNRSQS